MMGGRRAASNLSCCTVSCAARSSAPAAAGVAIGAGRGGALGSDQHQPGGPVKQVLARVEELTKEFSRLTYFQLLERPGARSDVEVMGKGLAFFVMSFQDMLRLNAASMSDPELARIAKGQRHDDAGHDVWFVNDLLQLQIVP